MSANAALYAAGACVLSVPTATTTSSSSGSAALLHVLDQQRRHERIELVLGIEAPHKVRMAVLGDLLHEDRRRDARDRTKNVVGHRELPKQAVR